MYAVNEEPIVLSKPLMDKLLSQPRPADLIALYCFYYYTAKWQETNQPKATISYTANGLHWGEDRVRKIKKELISLGLIEGITTRGEGNRVTGHFIKVNFIWKNSTLVEIQRVEMDKGNTLSTNREIKKKLNKKISLDSINELLPQEWQTHKPLQELLNEFTLHREQLKRPLTPVAIKRLTNKLTQYSIPTVTEALKKSIESGWTGVFPESIKPEEDKPTKGPKEVIQEYFKGKKDDLYAQTFYKGVYTDAENLLTDISNGQCSTLALNIVGLYNWIITNQTIEASKHRDIPTPVNLISRYVDWLEQQDWLDKEPSMFTPTHTIWKRKFLAKQSSEIGVDIITGKYFK